MTHQTNEPTPAFGELGRLADDVARLCALQENAARGQALVLLFTRLRGRKIPLALTGLENVCLTLRPLEKVHNVEHALQAPATEAVGGCPDGLAMARQGWNEAVDQHGLLRKTHHDVVGQGLARRLADVLGQLAEDANRA